MKKDNSKRKWLIKIILVLTIFIIGLLIYLYFTNRIDYLVRFKWKTLFESLSNVQKWLLSGSLVAIIVLSILTSTINSFLKNLLSPSKEKEIWKDNKKILQEQNNLNELIKNLQIDPRNLENYIKELPIAEGKRKVVEKINEWYQVRKINSNEKEILLVSIYAIFEQIKRSSKEIEILKSKGKNEVANIFEKNKKYLKEGNAIEIKNNYFAQREKNKKDEIDILKNSIELTNTLFAYEVTEDLYKELIKLEPTEENYFNFAYFYQKYKMFNKAGKLYEEALQIYRELAKENPRTYLPDVAMTLNNLAILHSNQNEYGDALEKYEEALQIYRELAKENPRTYLPYVATTLNNLANLHSDQNEYGDALEKYEEALQIRRELAKENPRTYLPDVAMTLNNFAILHSNQNEYGDALEKYEEALQIYRELAKENPRTYLPDVAMTLNNFAVLQKAKNEYGDALEKYEEALQIRRGLAKENPRTYLPYVATTLNNLAILHSDQNEYGDALEKYEEALQIRRELAKENPRTYLPDVAVTIINLSIFYLQSVSNKEKSISLAIEAVKILYPIYKQVPYLEGYLQKAIKILKNYDIDVDEILRIK